MKFNELQRFIKNFFFKVLSSLITVAIGIVVTSHLSRALDVRGFGQMNFLTTYTSYFMLFTTLGMDIVAIRAITMRKEKVKEIIGALVPLKLIFTAVVFIIMLAPALFIHRLGDFGWTLVVFSLVVLGSPFSIGCAFEADKRMEFPAAIAVASQIVNLSAVVFFIKSPEDLVLVGAISALLTFFSAILSNIIFVKVFGRWRLNFNGEMWREFLVAGIIIGVIQITVQMLHYLDTIMLGFIKDDIAVGLYSAAYRAMFMIISLMGIFHNLMNPILFENFNKDMPAFRKYFDHYFKFMIYLGYGVTVIFIILSTEYLGIFYDLTRYNQTNECFRILMLSLFFMTVNSPLHSGLLASHRERTLAKIIILQLAGNIAGNLLLIPRYGIIGSSIATVATEVIGLPFYLYHFRKVTGFTVLRHLAIACISAVPMGIFLYYSQIHFLLRGAIGVAIMVLFAILLRGYTIDELLNIKKNLITVNK